MTEERISERALRLAEEFLASARSEILEVAESDLEQLHRSAAALRAAATDRSSPGKSAEQVAFALVASAFNQALKSRTPQGPPPNTS